jgi:voltage-gated potassium channel
MSPVAAIALRIGVAALIVVVNWGLVVVERDGYTDTRDGTVSVSDALYYTTVTLTTTGYGDITPVTARARLINALAVTPMRFLFVVILVGTTLYALTRQSREEFRLSRWRKRVNDHIVVCGYGTKGRNAVRALLLQGQPTDAIVVVEKKPAVAAEASAAGLASVAGDSTRTPVLKAAHVERARAVIISLDRDDTAILATLRTRSIVPNTTIVVTARDAANGELLRQSGATSVIVSAETSGRLLGLAAGSPQTVGVVEDLLSFGVGLDLVSRPTTPEEVGKRPVDIEAPVLAVIREERRYLYSDPVVAELAPDDVLLFVRA